MCSNPELSDNRMAVEGNILLVSLASLFFWVYMSGLHMFDKMYRLHYRGMSMNDYRWSLSRKIQSNKNNMLDREKALYLLSALVFYLSGWFVVFLYSCLLIFFIHRKYCAPIRIIKTMHAASFFLLLVHNQNECLFSLVIYIYRKASIEKKETPEK